MHQIKLVGEISWGMYRTDKAFPPRYNGEADLRSFIQFHKPGVQGQVQSSVNVVDRSREIFLCSLI